MTGIYNFVSGGIIGFLIAKIFAGKKEGEKGLIGSIKFSIGKYKIHLHHWIIATLVLVFLFSIGVYNNFVYGLFFGIIVQGLCYRDFYKIIYKQ